jgi:branched-subunit amino acid aminotransferase/4-amino-4-deoxychorismate lyase
MDKRDRASRPMARDAIVHRTIADESNNMLCEASSGNLFWVKGEKIYTPSLATGCLEGGTRAVLMRLMKIEEIVAPLAILETADEVFITNCAWGVLPVTSLKPQGWRWQIGARAKQLQTALKHDIEQYAHQHRSMA